MAYISVSREHWTRGKRKKTYYAWWREYDISDDLWVALNKFAEEDEFSDTAVYDWEEDQICLSTTNNLDEVFKTYSKAPKDWELFHDVVEKENGRIKMKPMKYKYEYFVKVLKIDSVNQRAFIEHFPTRKQLQEAIDFETKKYWVRLSDRCVFEGVKPRDVVCVRKFLDDSFLAVYVSESAETEEERKARIKEQMKSSMDLMGDY